MNEACFRHYPQLNRNTPKNQHGSQNEVAAISESKQNTPKKSKEKNTE